MRIEIRGGEEKPIFFGGLFFITIARETAGAHCRQGKRHPANKRRKE
jgi:hypothetical protein